MCSREVVLKVYAIFGSTCIINYSIIARHVPFILGLTKTETFNSQKDSPVGFIHLHSLFKLFSASFPSI